MFSYSQQKFCLGASRGEGRPLTGAWPPGSLRTAPEQFVAGVSRRGNDGRTPVHVAAYSASVAVLERLVDAGGDLRLHDSAGRSARDWAAARPASRQRTKMLDYLNKAKLTALNSSTRDFLELSMHRTYAVSFSHVHLDNHRNSNTRLVAIRVGLPG